MKQQSVIWRWIPLVLLLRVWQQLLSRFKQQKSTIDDEALVTLEIKNDNSPLPVEDHSSVSLVALDDDTSFYAVKGKTRGWEEIDSARWHFKGAILDRLDEYFFCMRHVQREDPDAYNLFSRLGLAIPSDLYTTELNSTFRPLTFGGVLFPKTKDLPEEDEEGGCIYPSFFYFQKLQRPIGVTCIKGAQHYKLTFLFDDRIRQEHSWLEGASGTLCMRCYVAMLPSGEVILLRESRTTTSEEFKVGLKHRVARDHRKMRLSVRQWTYPEWLVMWSQTPNNKKQKLDSPQLIADFFMRLAIATYSSAIEKIIIRAERDGTVATFGIDVSRCKYFFADRGVEVLAADGRKKRIFHSVTQHDRHLKTRTVIVKQHYRGLRDFPWKTTRIHIVFPKNNTVLKFEQPAIEHKIDEPLPPELMASTEAADVFAKLLSE